jgi:hypothetical protein
MSLQPLIIKPGMSSTPTDLDGLRRLRDLKPSVSERIAKDESSEEERVGKTTGQGL